MRDVPALNLEGYAVPDCSMTRDDPFRGALEIVRCENGQTVLKINMAAEIHLPMNALNEPGDVAGIVASAAGERLHTDIWHDLVPLIKEQMALHLQNR